VWVPVQTDRSGKGEDGLRTKVRPILKVDVKNRYKTVKDSKNADKKGSFGKKEKDTLQVRAQGKTG